MKIFVVASMSTIAGLVIASSLQGCGGGIAYDGPDSGSSGAGSSGRGGSGSVGGSGSTGSGGGKTPPPLPPPPAPTCPYPDEIDATTFPWKPPAVVAGACSLQDLESLKSFVTANDDPLTWAASVTTPTCRDCIFAPDNGVTWAPIVLDATGEPSLFNVGGCIAVATGNDACGRAYQQWRSCFLEACAECPDGDFNAYAKCTNSANKGACKKAFESVVPTCGGNEIIGDAEVACDGDRYVFEGSIRAQCIGTTDGG